MHYNEGIRNIVYILAPVCDSSHLFILGLEFAVCKFFVLLLQLRVSFLTLPSQ